VENPVVFGAGIVSVIAPVAFLCMKQEKSEAW
jgi:hypothetical protein